MFSCQFCKIFKDTLSTELFRGRCCSTKCTCLNVKAKLFSLRLIVSLCNLNYLQVSVKGKYQRNKIKQQQKNKIKIKKIDQSIAKFFLLHSLILQYLIIPLKYQLSIIKKNSERYNEIVFYKKVIRKIFTIFTEKPLCWSLFLNKNAGLQF